MTTARPIQAALTSAATFTAVAALPLDIVIIAAGDRLVVIEAHGSLLFLALRGAAGARAGGAPIWKATARVTFWGALAMTLTAGIGMLVGTAGWWLSPDHALPGWLLWMAKSLTISVI